MVLEKNNYAEGMLKGRMAETLVEELLKKSGNVVYRFGYEAIVQNLVQLEKSFDRYSEVGERIRAIPDFIVIDKKGEPTFVEVKFRFKPELNGKEQKRELERLDRIHRFWNAKLIFVNCWEQPYFRIADPPYCDKNHNLVLRPLINEKSWQIDEKTYAECEALVHKYLTPTLVPKMNKK